jgi:hypothetical protein
VLWAIDVGLPTVQLRIDAAAGQLNGLLLDRQIAALQQSPVTPLDVLTGGLSSFASAAYLGVADDSGGIEPIRACLGAGSDTHVYTPHVTVGLYADAWPTDTVRPKLTAYAPPCIGGRLGQLATYDLAEKRLHWHGAALVASGSLVKRP